MQKIKCARVNVNRAEETLKLDMSYLQGFIGFKANVMRSQGEFHSGDKSRSHSGDKVPLHWGTGTTCISFAHYSTH